MSYLDTLKSKRGALTAERSTLVAALTARGTTASFTAGEQARFDELNSQARDLATQIERVESEDSAQGLAAGALGARGASSVEDRELGDRFRSIIRQNSREPIEVSLPVGELRSGFRPGIERRTLSTTTSGGLVPTSFYNTLQRHLVESSAILAAGATVIQSQSGEPLKVPKTTALSTATLITEGAVIPASDPAFSSVTLGGYKYGFLVQVSTELSQDAGFDLLGFLAEQSGIAVGNAFGADAISGNGTNKPRGLLTDATLGVTGPTGTATSFGAQTTAGQGGDLLLDLVASLAEPYARSHSAAFLMRNSTLNVIRKLRDSTGRYVFDALVIPGSGSVGTLLGYPVYLDPNMPAIAAGAKSILFGDISRYWIRQINGLRFERSDDFAFDRDLITFRGLARLDGALIDTTGAVKYFQHSAT